MFTRSTPTADLDPTLASQPHGPLYLYTRKRIAPIRVGEPRENEGTDGQDLYEVRIIDNDHNTYGEVMEVSMDALGVSEEEAFAIAWDVDHRGSCAVAEGPFEEAEAIARVIRTIGIEVQVNRIGHA